MCYVVFFSKQDVTAQMIYVFIGKDICSVVVHKAQLLYNSSLLLFISPSVLYVTIPAVFSQTLSTQILTLCSDLSSAQTHSLSSNYNRHTSLSLFYDYNLSPSYQRGASLYILHSMGTFKAEIHHRKLTNYLSFCGTFVSRRIPLILSSLNNDKNNNCWLEALKV